VATWPPLYFSQIPLMDEIDEGWDKKAPTNANGSGRGRSATPEFVAKKG
jgi:hypothetical protein